MMGNAWGWMWLLWPLIILGIVFPVVVLVRGTTTRTPEHGGRRVPHAVARAGEAAHRTSSTSGTPAENSPMRSTKSDCGPAR
jgi:hypothetical protein